jgi:hypothetical protein
MILHRWFRSAIFFSSLVLLPAFLQAQTPPLNITKLGAWPGLPEGQVSGLVVANGRVYVGMAGGGLHIFDASNPTNLVHVGFWDTGPSYVRLDVAGSFAYVASPTGLKIVDVSDPKHPLVISSYSIAAHDVKIVGPLAYLAASSGLTILNIADPAKPSLVGTYSTSVAANKVEVAGTIAYLGLFLGGGLHVVDVSDPAQPVRRMSYPGDEVSDVQATTNRLYVAQTTKLVTFDRDGSGNLTQASSVPLRSGISVCSLGDLLYVGNALRELTIFNVQDSKSPKRVGANQSADALVIKVLGNVIYAGGNFGLHVLNNQPEQWSYPKIVGTKGQVLDIKVTKSLAIVAEGETGVELFDLGTQPNPVLLSSFSINGAGITNVTIRGDFAFLGLGDSGVEVLDISNPVSPTLVAAFPSSGRIHHIEPVGTLAYIAEGRLLSIYDVSKIGSPTLLGAFFPSPSEIRDVRVQGNIAYAVGGRSLLMIDVSDPTAPFLLGEHTGVSEAWGIFLDGTRLYVADGNDGLVVLDVSIPDQPQRIGSSSHFIGATVEIVGKTAYVFTDLNGLRTFDVTDPRAPIPRAIYPNFGNTGRFEGNGSVVGSSAYIGAGSGFAVVDLSKPSGPLDVQNLLNSGLNGFKTTGGIAYVASGVHGLLVLDLTDPVRPRSVTQVPLRAGAVSVDVAADYAYVGCDPSLQVLSLREPLNPVRVADYGWISSVRQLKVAGDWLYVLEIAGGPQIEILDITDRLRPQQTAIIKLAVSGAPTFQVNGSTLLILGGQEIQVFDVSNPPNPTKISTIPLKNSVGAHVNKNLVYVAQRSPDRLNIVDISNPKSPLTKSIYIAANSPTSMAVRGDRAYLTDIGGRIGVIDLTDPLKPIGLVSYDAGSFASQIAVSDSEIYALTTDLLIFGVPTGLKLKFSKQDLGGRGHISFSGGSPAPVRLESSGDLRNWSTISSNAESPYSVEPTSAIKLFFRARQ